MKAKILTSLCILPIIAGCVTPPSVPATALPTPTVAPPRAGELAGHVNIGPLQPVVRVDATPAPVPPEVYAARSINIFAADGKTLVTNVKINSDGTYRVSLAPGTYTVDIARSGIDRGRGLPATITIEAGKTVQLDISIDTGIR